MACKVDGNAPECAATLLMEHMTKNAEDPAYMEDVIKSALGSAYTGKLKVICRRTLFI